MSRSRPWITLSALLGAVALHAAPAGAQLGGIEVGEPFPDLVLPALDDGAPTSIRDFRGRRVLLMVFASW